MRTTDGGCGEAGFTYMGLLLAVALFGVALAAVGQVWSTTLQIEREHELLFIGDEFKRAVAAYYDGTPGGAKQFPKSLEDLLLDRRYPTVRRHLRKIRADPMTGRSEWGLIKGPGDTIMGVYSLSTGKPRKQTNFSEEYSRFDGAKSHADWRFEYDGPAEPHTTAEAAPEVSGRLIPVSAITNGSQLQPQFVGTK